MRTRARNHRANFLNRLVALVAFVTIPTALAIVGLMIYAGISRYLTALVALLLALVVGYCLATIRARVSFQFMTISVLLDGLEIGDYSLRGRRHRGDDSLDGVVVQVNRLADELARQRASVRESRLLLEKVIRQIGVAILAFDDRDEVVLANPAAAALYDFSSEEILRSNVLLLAPRRCLRRTTIQWSTQISESKRTVSYSPRRVSRAGARSQVGLLDGCTSTASI